MASDDSSGEDAYERDTASWAGSDDDGKYEEVDSPNPTRVRQFSSFDNIVAKERRRRNEFTTFGNGFTAIPFERFAVLNVNIQRRPNSFAVMSVKSFNERFISGKQAYTSRQTAWLAANISPYQPSFVEIVTEEKPMYVAASAYAISPRPVLVSKSYEDLANGVVEQNGNRILTAGPKMDDSPYCVVISVRGGLRRFQLTGAVGHPLFPFNELGTPDRRFLMTRDLRDQVARSWLQRPFFFRGGPVDGPFDLFISDRRVRLYQGALIGPQIHDMILRGVELSFDISVYVGEALIPVYMGMSARNLTWVNSAGMFDCVYVNPLYVQGNMLFSRLEEGTSYFPTQLALLIRALTKCGAALRSGGGQLPMPYLELLFTNHFFDVPSFSSVIYYVSQKIGETNTNGSVFLLKATTIAAFLLEGFRVGEWWGGRDEFLLFCDCEKAMDMLRFLLRSTSYRNIQTVGDFQGFSENNLAISFLIAFDGLPGISF